jgi:hypothetical protein
MAMRTGLVFPVGAVLVGWVTLVGGPAGGAEKGAGGLAYLLSSSTQDEESVAWYGYNAVDGKVGTAWCSGPDPVGQRLLLGFVRQEHITHVSVVPGLVEGGKLNRTRARVRVLELNNGKQKRTVELKDDVAAQELALEPPLDARQLALTVREVYPGESRDAPACLADVTLRDGPTVLTGEAVTRAARGFPRPKLKLVGPWVDEPTAPERFFTLSLDGTFAWSHAPLMEGEPSSLHGTWDLGGGKLTLKPKGGGKPVVLKAALNRMEGRGGAFEQLDLEGTDGPEKLPGHYRPAEIINR